MTFLSSISLDLSNSALTTKSRLNEVKRNVEEVKNAINGLEHDMILFLMFPNVINLNGDNQSDSNDDGILKAIRDRNLEFLKSSSTSFYEIVDKITGLEDVKNTLNSQEYFYSEMYEDFKRKLEQSYPEGEST